MQHAAPCPGIASVGFAHPRTMIAASLAPQPGMRRCKAPWNRPRPLGLRSGTTATGIGRRSGRSVALDVSVPASAQLAVTQELSTAEQLRRANLGDFTPPNLEPLPPVPNSSSLLDIMPYLMKLALADTTLLIRLVLAFSCMAISKSSGLAVPVLFKTAVDHLTVVPSQAAFQAAATAVLVSGLCRMLTAVFKELQDVIFSPVSQAAGRRVGYHMFYHVLGLDTSFHIQRATGELSRRLERGTRSISMVFRALVFTFLPTALELCLVCGILWTQFSALVAALVVATFVGYTAWTASLTQQATDARKNLNAMDDLTSGKAIDALLNFETVNLFNNAPIEVAQYDRYLVGYQKAALDTERLSAMLNAGQGVILAAGLTAVCYAVTVDGTATAGDLVMISGLLLQLWAPLQFLGWFYRELRRSLVDMDAFFDIMRTKSLLVDGHMSLCATHTHKLFDCGEDGAPQNGGRQECAGNFEDGMTVELCDVHFAYDNGRKVLNGVNIRAEAGQSVAIVGPSGSGKSTVLKLIVRLYDADRGLVKLEGVDIRDLRIGSLRNAVAVVPQDTVLFNDTIFRNIEYGRPGATAEEVFKAARMAQLEPTINRMPDGYNTLVGERGLKLSGGEKQRVAIARAFLREPRLLICDESTSALDTGTERGIMKSLADLAVGRTSIFVAHRLSTVRNCDKIVVMAEGKVIEEGSHDELISCHGVYYNMWEAQQEAELQEAMSMVNS